MPLLLWLLAYFLLILILEVLLDAYALLDPLGLAEWCVDMFALPQALLWVFLV
jgi:hypothetical protein